MSAVAEGAELVYRASSMLLLLAAVRDGLGMSCLPRYLCDGEPELIRAFNVPEEHYLDSPPRPSSRQRAHARLYRLHAERVSKGILTISGAGQDLRTVDMLAHASTSLAGERANAVEARVIYLSFEELEST